MIRNKLKTLVPSQLWQLAAKHKRFIKFCLVGAMGAVIDVGILTALVELAGWSILLANTVSFVAAITNGFFWNKHWTFRNKESKHLQQFVKFATVAVVGLLINFGLMWLGLKLGFYYLAVKAVIIVIVAFWNYTINKLWTFRHSQITGINQEVENL